MLSYEELTQGLTVITYGFKSFVRHGGRWQNEERFSLNVI